jgi:hypothetical protein
MALESLKGNFIPFDPNALKGLDEDILEVLREGLEGSTRARYRRHVTAYLKFCLKENNHPRLPSSLVRWLAAVRRQSPNLHFESFKARRSAVSTFFSLSGEDERTIGEHPLVTAFMRGLAKCNPTDLRRADVEDINLPSVDRVLKKWEKQEVRGELPYEKEAARAAFLLYLTGLRGCDMMRIVLSKCIIPEAPTRAMDLKMSSTKESKIKRQSGSVWQKVVPSTLTHWCPVRAVLALMAERPAKAADTLLIEPDGEPYRRADITRLVRILLVEAGMPKTTRVHTLRLVGVTTALAAAIPEALVRKTFRLSLTSDTLDRHYLRPVAAVAQAVAESVLKHRRKGGKRGGGEEPPEPPEPQERGKAVHARTQRVKGRNRTKGRKLLS